MNDNYGVARDIFTKMKVVGFFMRDIVWVCGTTFLAFLFAPKVFPNTQLIQMILFVILTAIIAFYLVLPANGNKKNWQSLLIMIKRRKRRWVSFDWDRKGRS